MTTTPTSTFTTTSDGEPFEVVWNRAGHADHLWRWNQDHHGAPMSFLEEWIWQHPPGRLRAYAEAGIDAPPPFRGFEVHHGFQYLRADPLAGEESEQFIARSRALSARFGGACNVWPQYSLPRVQATCGWIRKAAPETSVRALSEAFNYAFHLTHVAGMGVFIPLTARLIQLLTPAFGAGEAALLAQEVGQGSDNATVDSDRAVARLADCVRANPELEHAVRVGRMPSRAEISQAGDFFDRLDSFFETYGDRAQTWGIDHPTMREEPAFVWGMIRATLAVANSPDTRRNAQATREAAIARIAQGLAGKPEVLANVRAVADELKDYVAVREGRALWQLTAGGVLRTKLLEKGRVLAARGTVSSPDDIRFLLPDEIDPCFEEGARADLRSLVAERRELHQSRLKITPPRFITGRPELLPAVAAASPETLTGIGAARGRITAPARLVLGLDDADALEPGEVLVCAMTSPPWTPLFGLAGAVVTDSGMVLSHPAIAAREYGIPAVVGTGDATTRIRTGDTITVDGDAGTVRIEARA